MAIEMLKINYKAQK